MNNTYTNRELICKLLISWQESEWLLPNAASFEDYVKDNIHKFEYEAEWESIVLPI